MPAEVAGELKETGKTEVKYFESVTVLFAEEIEAKNIGKVKTYFITRLKPEYSKDEWGFEPNEKFWERHASL
ncbi:MAG: hypothetical protein EAZ55_11640 [Cytophagales bacterium]|nr:MAG: hypothetical protein EAZ55_11640 [Cytophagales bacterium]